MFHVIGACKGISLKRVVVFKNGILIFAVVISFSHRTGDLYDPYCIVKTRPAESVHLVYQYSLLEGTRV